NYVYPDYWTDPNILICPSDSRSHAGHLQWVWGLEPVPVEADFGAQIQKIANNPNPIAKEWWLPLMLSINPSYVYIPWATRTSSQLAHVIRAQINLVWDPAVWGGMQAGTEDTWGTSWSIMRLLRGTKTELTA